MITLELAGAPMGKERVRLQKAAGILFTPERTLTYEARLAAAGQAVMGNRPLLVGNLAIEIEAYIMIPASKPKKWQADARKGLIRPTKKPDIDNICKIVCDGLNLVLWRDDCEIVDARLTKWYSDRPRLVLRAWEMKAKGVFG